MSYHTRVTKSYDFYTSLEKAREIAADIEGMLKQKDASAEFFPYRSVLAFLRQNISFRSYLFFWFLSAFSMFITNST